MSRTSNHKNSAAFFDLDLTLTQKDCFRLFLKSIYLTRISGLTRMSGFVYLPYLAYLLILRKSRLISLRAFKERSLIMLKGLTQGRITALGNLFFQHRIKPMLRRKALGKIQWHKCRGDRIFVISASPDIYVQAVCEFLGCDDYACTRLAYDNGKFTGHITGPDCLGQEKETFIHALAKWHKIDLTTSSAYSDHESDLPFFESFGKKVAVSPTPTLEQVALSKNWEIVKW